MTCVPEEFFIAALHVPILKGMWVVNQVWKCPGFYLHHATSREYLHLYFIPMNDLTSYQAEKLLSAYTRIHPRQVLVTTPSGQGRVILALESVR